MTWIADREKALSAPHLREAPVFSERTSVGLDVHARSIVGCGLDTVSGQVSRRRLTPTFEGVSSWLAELPAPVAVAYEAGPTGFGLARQLTAAGIRCVVAAPSKLQRPPGDRVKTMLGTPVTLRTCCGWIRSSRSGYRVWSRRPRGIWCGPGRTSAGT